ncbi:MAG: hypothetical protein CL975_00010 [Euryarchaeota archaeon]|nr:hypothetical protein [Euryarchaeota archaeon]
MKNQTKKIAKRTDKFLEAEPIAFGHWALLFLIAVLVAIGLGGCNTIAGFGQDVQALASGTQEYLTRDSSDNVNRNDP